MELVATGFAGLAGSRLIYETETLREQLLRRYAPQFFRNLLPQSEDSGLTGPVSAAAFSGKGAADLAEQQTELTPEEARRQADAKRQFARLREEAAEGGRLQEAGDGGVYAALWQLLKQNRSGAVYSQRAIPIRQETIEICETFSLNPYRLYAAGCTLWLTPSGAALCQAAEEAGLPAAVIGFQAPGAAILRRDCPEDAFLRRPEADALGKLGLRAVV